MSAVLIFVMCLRRKCGVIRNVSVSIQREYVQQAESKAREILTTHRESCAACTFGKLREAIQPT